MALETTVEELQEEIGHTMIPHSQEFIEPAMRRGFTILRMDVFPCGREAPLFPVKECVRRFLNQLDNRHAVLLDNTHAVAVSPAKLIYDSKGHITVLNISQWKTGFILIPNSNHV